MRDAQMVGDSTLHITLSNGEMKWIDLSLVSHVMYFPTDSVAYKAQVLRFLSRIPSEDCIDVRVDANDNFDKEIELWTEYISHEPIHSTKAFSTSRPFQHKGTES